MNKPLSIVNKKADKSHQVKNDFYEGIKTLTEIMPQQIELYAIHAKALKAKSDALTKAGFTEEQALEIVKTRPIFE